MDPLLLLSHSARAFFLLLFFFLFFLIPFFFIYIYIYIIAVLCIKNSLPFIFIPVEIMKCIKEKCNDATVSTFKK